MKAIRMPPPGSQLTLLATLPRKRGRDKMSERVAKPRMRGKQAEDGQPGSPARPRRLRRRYHGKRER
jgi:hypothetical protein